MERFTSGINRSRVQIDRSKAGEYSVKISWIYFLVFGFLVSGNDLLAQTTEVLFPWEAEGKLVFIKPDGTIFPAEKDTLNYPKIPTEQAQLLAYRENSVFGFKDSLGQIIVPAGYEKVGNFKEGYAWVKLDYKRYYFIDQNEQPLISYTFDKCFDFCSGLAKVYDKNANKDHRGYGYLNNMGQIAIPLHFKKANDFINENALVKDEKGWWLIDKSGKRIAGPAANLQERNNQFWIAFR